ncbi:MAG TPA: rod shape-determining protein MreC [bacterium]|nr:rod shape-determining protein MreC [bacterium]HOR57375.1 rod shape-determining protein MreC [bacterium]HPL56186.1 rod shape-determining protein MreC [bacterium]
MKHLPVAIAVLFVATVLAVWPLSREVWQKSVGASANYVACNFSFVTDRALAMLRLTSIDKALKEEQEKNTQLSAEVATLQALEKENEILRAEIDLNKQLYRAEKAISARVISRSPANFLQSYVLDVGANQGVEVGQTVTSSGYLLGQVRSVTPNTSEVILITSGRLLLPAILQNSKATGVISGGLEGLTLEEISLDTQVEEGELIFTQDIDGIVVANIPVATVSSVQARKGDIFQTIIANSPLDFTKITVVNIIKN